MVTNKALLTREYIPLTSVGCISIYDGYTGNTADITFRFEQTIVLIPLSWHLRPRQDNLAERMLCGRRVPREAVIISQISLMALSITCTDYHLLLEDVGVERHTELSWSPYSPASLQHDA